MSFVYDKREYAASTWTLEHMPLQQALAALAAGVAAWAVLTARAVMVPGGWWGGVWSALALAIAVGLTAWLLCLAALGNEDLAALTGRLRGMK